MVAQKRDAGQPAANVAANTSERRGDHDANTIVDQQPTTASAKHSGWSTQPSAYGSPPVARLTAAAGCRWNGLIAPVLNDVLRAGQSLHLASGVVELDFDTGVKVILQGPAAMQFLSPISVRLETGKATAQVKSATARGFTIITPEATVADQGTEFGVEVSPGGSSKVHVFQGMVDLELKSQQHGRAVSISQRLAENAGARIEGQEE